MDTSTLRLLCGALAGETSFARAQTLRSAATDHCEPPITLVLNWPALLKK
jgi:hypothetical protein